MAEKLSVVITQLQKAKDDYVKKHKVEPVVWGLDSSMEKDDTLELTLCSGKKKCADGLGSRAIGKVESYDIEWFKED